MTSELLYEKVIAMMEAYDRHTGSQGTESVIKDPHAWTGDAARYMPFYGLAADILIDALEGMEKKTTAASMLAAVKRVIKATEKTNPRLAGIFQHPCDTSGYYLCDGCRLFRFCDDFQSVKHLENAPFDVSPMFKQMTENTTGDPFPLPSVASLKAFQKAEKGRGQEKNRRPACINEKYFFNPQFLIDLLQIFPDARAICPESTKSPLFIHSKDGLSMLLPVRPSETITSDPAKLEQIKVA